MAARKFAIKKEPVFITKSGYGDLVIMNIATYEAMLDTMPHRCSEKQIS